jgi:hypothetical protein
MVSEIGDFSTDPTPFSGGGGFVPMLLWLVLITVGFFIVRKKKKARLIFLVTVGVLILGGVSFALFNQISQTVKNNPENVYSRAVEKLEAGDYIGAWSELVGSNPPLVQRQHDGGFVYYVSDYKDAAFIANYGQAWMYLDFGIGHAGRAITLFEFLGNFRNSREMVIVAQSSNILGRWSSPQENLVFFDDGTFETVLLGGVVISGRWFFENSELVTRVSTLGITTETRFSVLTDYNDSLTLNGTSYTRVR